MEQFAQKFTDLEMFKLTKIDRIGSPDEFYQTLICHLKESENIQIHSMYFGLGKKCKNLLFAIQKRKMNNKQTKIILDANRGRTIDFKLMIKKLGIEDCFEFRDVSSKMLCTRMKEIQAVYHTKLFILDDSVIMTGANIDNTYFTNRLDRYFKVSNKDLVRYLLHSNTSCKKLQNFTDCTSVFSFEELKERKIVSKLLEYKFDEVYISSAYFNPPKIYLELFKKCKKINFIVSSPECNVFMSFGILNKLITQVYRYSSFYITSMIEGSRLYEFNKKGCTMHIKGIWAFKEDFCASIIGSSNFNRRSSERDKELNFLVFSNETKTKDMFLEEINFLFNNSSLVPSERIRQKTWPFLIIFVYFVFNMLF